MVIYLWRSTNSLQELLIVKCSMVLVTLIFTTLTTISYPGCQPVIMFIHAYPHKPLRKIKVAICNRPADSPFYLWPNVRFGNLQTEDNIVTRDTESPYCNQVSINNTNTISRVHYVFIKHNYTQYIMHRSGWHLWWEHYVSTKHNHEYIINQPSAIRLFMGTQSLRPKL